jgi:hypothetical protein
VPSGTTNGPSAQGNRIEKYGPTVWEGVIPGTVVAPLYSKTVALRPRNTMSQW